MLETFAELGVNTQPQFWISVLEIIWINVLLSGDNALVIAMVCRGLPGKQRMMGMVLGTGVALGLRLVFTGVVATLMLLPFIKIAGGFALLWIAYKLLAPNEESGHGHGETDGLWHAVKLIALADVVMSLDNVIAVAAAAHGNFALLIFGLGVCVPAIVAGASLFMAMINYFPLTIWAGAALLGWIAGDIVATDPIIAERTHMLGASAAKTIEFTMAALGVIGVLAAGLIARSRQMRQHALDL